MVRYCFLLCSKQSLRRGQFPYNPEGEVRFHTIHNDSWGVYIQSRRWNVEASLITIFPKTMTMANFEEEVSVGWQPYDSSKKIIVHWMWIIRWWWFLIIGPTLPRSVAVEHWCARRGRGLSQKNMTAILFPRRGLSLTIRQPYDPFATCNSSNNIAGGFVLIFSGVIVQVRIESQCNRRSSPNWKSTALAPLRVEEITFLSP